MMKYWKLFTGVVIGVIGFILYNKYTNKNNNAQALPVDVVKNDIKEVDVKIEEVQVEKSKVEQAKVIVKEEIKQSKQKSAEVKEQIAAVEKIDTVEAVDANEATAYLKKFSKK